MRSLVEKPLSYAGIDFGLRVAAELAGTDRAERMQPMME